MTGTSDSPEIAPGSAVEHARHGEAPQQLSAQPRTAAVAVTAARGADPDPCPYLAILEDPRTRYLFPTEAHRCRASGDARAIGLAKQSADCLGGRYQTCQDYVHAAPPVPVLVPALLQEPELARLAPSVLDPSVSGRTMLGAIGGALLLGSILGWMLLGAGGASRPTSQPSLKPTGAPTAAPSKPAAMVSPSARPSPSPSLTPTPSRPPTPLPAPTPFIYVVRSGDTLTAISLRFGTTVAALMEANQLTSDRIMTGQKLVIPPPASPSPAA